MRVNNNRCGEISNPDSFSSYYSQNTFLTKQSDHGDKHPPSTTVAGDVSRSQDSMPSHAVNGLLANIPHDLLRDISEWLSFKDLARSASVCSEFKTLREIQASTVKLKLITEYCLTGKVLPNSIESEPLKVAYCRSQLFSINAPMVIHSGQSAIRELVFSPFGQRFYSLDSDGRVKAWEQHHRDWLCSASFLSEHPMVAIALSADAHLFAALDQDGFLTMWNHSDSIREAVKLATNVRNACDLSVNADGSACLVIGRNNHVELWSQLSNKAWERQRLIVPIHQPTKACFSENHPSIAVMGDDHRACVLTRMSSGKWMPIVLDAHQKEITSINFSACGRYILTSANDRTARRWDIADNQMTSYCLERPTNVSHSAIGASDWVNAACFSRDGHMVLTANPDGAARLWHQTNSQVWHVDILGGHDVNVCAANISPDGGSIVTASIDGVVKMWSKQKNGTWSSENVATHAPGNVKAVFSPDGLELMTGDSVGDIRIWSRRSAV